MSRYIELAHKSLLLDRDRTRIEARSILPIHRTPAMPDHRSAIKGGVVKAKVRRKLDMGMRVLEFSRLHTDTSAGYVSAAARLEQLLTRADQLARQEVDGRSEVRAATARKLELRRQVKQAHLDHLTNVARVAAVEEPDLVQKFAFPRNSTSYRAFQTVAGSMAAEAESRKDLLIKHGLSEEVLAGLKVALDQFETAVEQGAAGRLTHVSAKAELEAVADEIVQVVKVMNGLIRIRFANQPETLAAWESATNVFGPIRPSTESGPEGSPSTGEVRPAA
jgi:NADH:quinone oxidoreductase NDUFB4/B15 subunit-like protein